MADDKDDKTEEPTARRLDEARKRGEIVYSQEATTWIMLAAGAMALSMLGPQMMRAIGKFAGLVQSCDLIEAARSEA